jgi:hypothetical protein
MLQTGVSTIGTKYQEPRSVVDGLLLIGQRSQGFLSSMAECHKQPLLYLRDVDIVTYITNVNHVPSHVFAAATPCILADLLPSNDYPPTSLVDAVGNHYS